MNRIAAITAGSVAAVVVTGGLALGSVTGVLGGDADVPAPAATTASVSPPATDAGPTSASPPTSATPRVDEDDVEDDVEYEYEDDVEDGDESHEESPEREGAGWDDD